MGKQSLSITFVISVLFLTSCQTTGLIDSLSEVFQTSPQAMKLETIVAGLKEALTVASRDAVTNTSRQGGFSDNRLVRIAMPRELEKVAATLRTLKLGFLVDDFEAKMNVAAEKAAEKAGPVFFDAIRQMTFADAKRILYGADTAATDYFRATTEKRLLLEFGPIVTTKMNEVGAVRAYNQLIQKYTAIPLVKKPELDIADYVTQGALDGLFTTLAAEEKKIRENPAARTTELLRTVFGNR